MSLDLSGNGFATNEEIDIAANAIFKILRSFKSPKDAAVALALAHVGLMNGSFAPEYREQAFAALDCHSKTVKDMMTGGLN